MILMSLKARIISDAANNFKIFKTHFNVKVKKIFNFKGKIKVNLRCLIAMTPVCLGLLLTPSDTHMLDSFGYFPFNDLLIIMIKSSG